MKKPIPLTGVEHHHTHTLAPVPTAMLRHEHEVILRALALLERLGGRLAAGAQVDRAALAWLLDFFVTFVDRCHHGKEEQHLFPALERHGIPREGGPLGVMLHEHEEGRALLLAIGHGNGGGVAEAIGRYALFIRDHIEKENEVLFPMAEQVLGAGEQGVLVQAFDAMEQVVAGPGAHERFLARLGELEVSSGEAVPRTKETFIAEVPLLDVRAVPPRERHLKIFETFDHLKAGEAFILVNDHDPKPLFYQLSFERPGAYTWQYLAAGPDVWRVRIGKR